MPADVDLRSLIGPSVLDQGTRPTCVPVASSVAHEALRAKQGHGPIPLAPEALWHYCTIEGHTSIDGMLLVDIAPALAVAGQPELALWPYDGRLGDGTEDPPPAAGVPPWFRARLGNLTLTHDGSEPAVEDALADSQPVILVIEITDEFLVPDEDGIVSMPDIRSATGGYHAILCVGAATHPTHGRLFLVRNSWGPRWGLGGYAWLPATYLIGFAVQAATVVDQGDEPQ